MPSPQCSLLINKEYNNKITISCTLPSTFCSEGVKTNRDSCDACPVEWRHSSGGRNLPGVPVLWCPVPGLMALAVLAARTKKRDVATVEVTRKT